MREFEKYEVFKTKCPVCGSKNKVHTELLNINNEFAGYSLKCCNCGNYNQFRFDHKTNGVISKAPYRDGKQHCIQPSYCPRKDCPLYGTYDLNIDAIDFKPELHNMDEPCEEESTVSIDVVNNPRFL